MEKGSLEGYLEDNKGSISYRRMIEWIISIAKALKLMHEKGFVHKDVKPDNILIS